MVMMGMAVPVIVPVPVTMLVPVMMVVMMVVGGSDSLDMVMVALLD